MFWMIAAILVLAWLLGLVSREQLHDGRDHSSAAGTCPYRGAHRDR
jgi:hypothetical protein